MQLWFTQKLTFRSVSALIPGNVLSELLAHLFGHFESRTVARNNELGHLRDLKTVLLLQFFIFRAGADPQVRVEDVFFFFEEIPCDGYSRVVLEVRVPDNQRDACFGVAGRRHNFDVLIYWERFLLEVMIVIDFVVRPARADEVISVQKQIQISDMVGVSVRTNDVIDLLGGDVVELQFSNQNIFVPRSQAIKLKIEIVTITLAYRK